MRRALVAVGLTALGAGLAPPLGGVAVAQADVGAFCQARLAVNDALAAGDEPSAEAAFTTLVASAPDEVQESVTTLADLVEKNGAKAFDSKKGQKAIAAIDGFVAESCGFPVFDVAATDYKFDGIPETIEAGPTVFRLTNDAPKEHHELVLFEVAPGVETPVKKLLALPEKKAEGKMTLVGAAHAEPGDTAVLVTTLGAGRYAYACFIPVAEKETTSHLRSTREDEGDEDEGHGGGTPHWKKGMFGEFTGIIVG
jgi:uncharacterized cupredoxin-like copper-binding protein